MRAGSTLSDTYEQEMGVPQDSILSPVLFSLKIYDIMKSVLKGSEAALFVDSRGGELRTKKLKSQLMRTQSLKVLPLKPGVGQYIAKLIFTLPVHSPAFFSKTSPKVFLC